MTAATALVTPTIAEDSKPVLPRYARLHFDKARDRWVLLVPERVMVPDETAVEILQLCDGERSLGEIIDGLAEKYVADRAEIAADVIEMIQDLADKGFVTDTREVE
jgi:pyrroloquinoline quinone biosynthesis protein D